MDRNSPVTDVVLEALAKIMAATMPETYPNWFEARSELEARIEDLADGVKPYSVHLDPELDRQALHEKLDRMEEDLRGVRLALALLLQDREGRG